MSEPSAVIVTAATVAKLARGVRLREDAVRGQTILLAPERALALDEIAVMIVNALDGKRSIDAIAEEFSLKFEAPKDQILADIIVFVDEFSKRRMLELKP
ncbi:pyrroloquinoline quinone biosynthesis peptide chaperone PqqD [Rhizobium sp. RM]|uniref:pyrroloquinoline quinone biosynthesis peptide chaperone PqqD n=1 Tax=Rhizobium sp. RM TaxID=2748079 RepID=UPI00110D5A6D|nr:pyrroloquinoline quinone biosynthesis peptide chaperone PqqD [Rhizobium sp. RM]NWJ25441.1 pyrroloquinoline quinone biosynthesis peptide chaperone PqqD [Rhizobium sp. RM]TMV22073.1 pyrroloquinoline quinone biosynthesis peptide chaperone PqqD [Rhizobium sp. Td3]